MLEERDRRLVELIIKENYHVIKDLYQHCLARSSDFPMLTLQSIYDEFLHLIVGWESLNEMAPVGEVQRYMIVEILVKLAYQTKQQQHTSVILR